MINRQMAILVLTLTLRSVAATATLKIIEKTSVSTVNKFLMYTVKTYRDYSFIFPFMQVDNPTPKNSEFTLSFNNNEDAISSNVQIFQIANKDAVLKLQEDHLNKSLFLDMNDKVLDCKDYFSDCETSFLKSQIYKQSIDGTFQEHDFLIYYFTKKGSTTANFDRTFQIEYSFLITTYEKYFNLIYAVLIFTILINIFTIFKHL